MRRWTLEITEHPDLTENRPYAMTITAIEKTRKPRGIRATLEHTTEEQLGRVCSVLFPSIVRPAGRAADLFRASGMAVSVGNTISPKDAEGASILVCFRRDPDTGDLQPATFEPVSKDDRDSKIASASDGATNSTNYQQESIDGQFTPES